LLQATFQRLLNGLSAHDRITFRYVYLFDNIGEPAALERSSDEVNCLDIDLVACKSTCKLADLGDSGGWEVNDTFEAPPDSRIEKLRVIGCCDKNTICRPFVDSLKENGYESLQFANIGRVIAPLSNRVELVEQ